MTSRVLDFEEWHRLPESLDPILAGLRPGVSRICVVEEGETIVGYWLLFPVLHAECLFVDPAYRQRVSVGRRLWKLMRASARSLGFDRVWACADSPQVSQMLAHPKVQGHPVPALSVIVPVGDTSCRL